MLWRQLTLMSIIWIREGYKTQELEVQGNYEPDVKDLAALDTYSKEHQERTS